MQSRIAMNTVKREFLGTELKRQIKVFPWHCDRIK